MRFSSARRVRLVVIGLRVSRIHYERICVGKILKTR